MAEHDAMTRRLLRLQAWLSPAFPDGGISHSHGLEEAIASGNVADVEELFGWVEAALSHGAGRVDGMLLATAWQAVAEGSGDRLMEIAVVGAAMSGAVELAKDSAAKGQAFLEQAQSAWPDPALQSTTEELARTGLRPVLPVAVAVVSACREIPIEAVLPIYLQTFAAAVVSAGVRLIPLTRTEGRRVIARLQPVVDRVSDAALKAPFEDIGDGTSMIDPPSPAHETPDAKPSRS